MGIGADGDGGAARISIVGDMIDRLRHPRARRRPTPDIERHPRPTEKPRPDAQWDEAAGRWEVWDEERQAWKSLEDGSLQQPGTPSTEPSPDAWRPR